MSEPTPPSQEDARKGRQRAMEQEAADFQWLMGTPQGRRVVWRGLDTAGVFRSSFSTDPLVMAFNEGRRNAGLRTLEQIHALCPQAYTVMMKEYNDGR